MPRRKSLFSAVDLTRALDVAKKAGLTISQTEIGPDGRIVLVHASANPDQTLAAPDDALAEWEASRRERRT